MPRDNIRLLLKNNTRPMFNTIVTFHPPNQTLRRIRLIASVPFPISTRHSEEHIKKSHLTRQRAVLENLSGKQFGSSGWQSSYTRWPFPPSSLLYCFTGAPILGSIVSPPKWSESRVNWANDEEAAALCHSRSIILKILFPATCVITLSLDLS